MFVLVYGNVLYVVYVCTVCTVCMYVRKSVVSSSERSKCKTYCDLNPDLSPPGIYTSYDIAEHDRIATTRLRLSAHNLNVETGRWARVPYNDRLCPCGTVQTEDHIICKCPLTADIRSENSDMNFSNICHFFKNSDKVRVCKICARSMRKFSIS